MSEHGWLKSAQCIGMSQLRVMTADRLARLDEPLVVFSHSQPVGALVPYETYLQWQELLVAIPAPEAAC